MTHSQPKHTPTPEEIRQQCELIRSEWTEEERQRRLARKPEPPVEAKQCKVWIDAEGS